MNSSAPDLPGVRRTPVVDVPQRGPGDERGTTAVAARAHIVSQPAPANLSVGETAITETDIAREMQYDPAPRDDVNGRLGARREAERLIGELSVNLDLFAEFAVRYSRCPSKDQGGRLGWLPRVAQHPANPKIETSGVDRVKTKTDHAVNQFCKIHTSKSHRFEPRLGFLARFDQFAKVPRVFTLASTPSGRTSVTAVG